MPTQLILAVLSAGLTFLGALWIYRKSKCDDEIRWRIEHIYEDGLAELTTLLEDDEYPGSLCDRQDNSFWTNLTYLEQLRLGPTLLRKGTHYSRLLADLETAERRVRTLNPDIMSLFPDDVVRRQGTAVQLLVGGIAEPDTETRGKNPPTALIFSNWVDIALVFAGRDTAILDVDSPQQLREHLFPDDGLENHPYPDTPTMFDGGFRPEYLSFWEDEFPDRAECLYPVVSEGLLEEYLTAREHEHRVKEQLNATAKDVREIMREEIKSLGTDD